MHDGAFCDDGKVCRAGADIDDRGRTFVSRQNTCPESGGETFFHHKDLADVSFVSGIYERTLFDVRHVRDHAHHGLERDVRAARLCLFDKVSEHPLGTFKVGNDAADQRSFDRHITSFAAAHLGCLKAKGDDLLGHLIDRDERRFVEHDAAALDRNDSTRGAEVDRHRVGDQFF